ncbi:MAG TPA: penicillin-binding transpeptidase domain-containing protein [Solirubrobacteraceae bacterium]|nr:penicillin-binding transpeptidase domain-containing protein [Solirubrobacteraceae bacterium]
MSAQITRLFGLVVVLFALLAIFTTRWTVIDAQSLNHNSLNHRTLIAAEKVKLGRILADDGTVLAQSVPAPGGIFTRRYPTGPEFAQAVGFAFLATYGYAGLEQQYRDQLQGVPTGLASVFGRIGGNQQVGNDLYTSLDPKAQRLAVSMLAGREGSVVALDPRTGSILAMYSNPSYDDNHPKTETFDYALQAHSPPGSTFKVVSTSAALDTGRFTPNSTINGNSPKTISGVPLQNDNNQSFGNIDLTTALTYSVNTVFAQLAVQLGIGTMTEYMKRFGFYSPPPLDYPTNELSISRPHSLSAGNRGLPPGDPNEDIGRIGIGQGGLEVTPMQMAMVVAAVANGGKLMRPHFATRIVDPDGRTVQTIDPSVYQQVMKPSTAAQLTQMMRKVVEEGTGAPAQLGGISVAGKTGTASIGAPNSGLTEPWFIGFAPAESPKVAVAVTIAQTRGGFGGSVAAPIAKAIIQLLLSEGR